MAKREQFWTTARLKELRKLWKSMSLPQLEKHFGRRREDIIQAHQFQQMHKRLKLSVKRHNGMRHTIYAPAHAEGSISGRRYFNDVFEL